MRYYRALIILLVAAIAAISGCIEFGATPSTAPATTAPQSATSYAIPGAQVPSTQVNVTLADIKYDRRADSTQAENITLTFRNDGTEAVTNVGFSIKAKDTPTGTSLHSGTVSVGTLQAGGKSSVTVPIPAHAYVNTMTLTVVVYWGVNPAYVNDETRPWVISLATNPYW